MKHIVTLVFWAVASMSHAADTPTLSSPTASERLASARQAIERKGWSRAQLDLRSVVRDEPDNADAHNLLAYTYRKQEKPNLSKAFEHYRIALKINPLHKGAHEYIGEAYVMDRKPNLAEKHLADLERICGNKTCEEYVDLAQSIAAYRKANP
jgi:Tfp pilus assembly protein PilF